MSRTTYVWYAVISIGLSPNMSVALLCIWWWWCFAGEDNDNDSNNNDNDSNNNSNNNMIYPKEWNSNVTFPMQKLSLKTCELNY